MGKILMSMIILIIIAGIGSTAMATTITYDIVDLGSGVWEYSYWVSEYTFNTDYGITVYFDYGLYENITPVSDSSDWYEISWKPDPVLGAGAYDALALTDSASLADPFLVSFNWLGAGTPWDYTQNFEVYDLTDPSQIQILETGTTTPVPEPATMFLLGSGLLGLAGAGITKKYTNRRHWA